MSSELPLGLAVDIGATNIRMAYADGDQLSAPSGDGLFDMRQTPTSTTDIFDVLAVAASAAGEQGAEWLVAGFPCPVKISSDSQLVGNAGNPANPFYGRHYDLQAELRQRGIDPNFHIAGRNDLTAFTYAAAQRAAKPDENRTLGIGLGTGVGTDFVSKDVAGNWRAMTDFPCELAAMFAVSPGKTLEDSLSGTAINRDIATLDQEVFWEQRSRALAELIFYNTALLGVDLAYVGGGAGGAYQRQLSHRLANNLDDLPFGWGHTSYVAKPRVEFVSPDEADYFALYGASAIAASAFYAD